MKAAAENPLAEVSRTNRRRPGKHAPRPCTGDSANGALAVKKSLSLSGILCRERRTPPPGTGPARSAEMSRPHGFVHEKTY